MILNSIKIENFRNYDRADCAFSPDVNVITGANAQGKTNLIEAAYYLSGASSFRARSSKELIRFGQSEFRLFAEIESEGREQTIDISLSAAGRKKILLNGVKKRSAAELSGKLCCVLFSPDDMELIRGGAVTRRRLMDHAISQLRPNYAACLARFNKYYEHKVRILRDWREKPALLEVLDDFNYNLAHLGAQLIYYRAAWCRRLREAAGAVHAEVSGRGEVLELSYKTVKTLPDPEGMKPQEILECLLEHQQSHRQAELDSGTVLSGAMKDDLIAKIGGVEAKNFASQGQARTAALSIKLAEREIIRSDTGEYPLLLLDDVLSELDEVRQDFVLNRIAGGQVFITCCDGRQVSARTGGRLIFVEGGRITEE
ncbi:MAG: DNA replication/repair protein RecF [Clostridiales bacterium]|nr:DNA replication/repair protein RecF [Clostridiales bacterium]